MLDLTPTLSLAYVRQQGLPKPCLQRLREHPVPAFPEHKPWEQHFADLGITKEPHRRIATEEALVGSVLARGWSADLVSISDDAGQMCCGCRQRPAPRILTYNELQHLLAETHHLHPPGSLRPLTGNTLFTVLEVIDLQPGEAPARRFDDLTQDRLLIRAAKFRKSRLVLLQESARAGLERYSIVHFASP